MTFPQEDAYLLPSEILKSIQREASGEKAWDMVPKISRFHRIRDIVPCEFDETDIGFAFRFAQELERLELISFKIGQT